MEKAVVYLISHWNAIQSALVGFALWGALFSFLLYASQRRPICWGAGIVHYTILIWLFVQERSYLALALPVGLIFLHWRGWWFWQCGGPQETQAPVSRCSPVKLSLAAVGLVAGTLLYGRYLRDSVGLEAPWAEAFTIISTIVGIVLLSYKTVESWLVLLSAYGTEAWMLWDGTIHLGVLLALGQTAFVLWGLIIWTIALHRHPWH